MQSVLINTNLLIACKENNVKRYFFSSSACAYNTTKQQDVFVEGLKEEDAYPANPEDGYGWEKLFSERLFLAYSRNYGIPVRIARFHNIFGPLGTWDGGREKAPAAICRKVIQADGEIEIWGDGKQTRSFLYVDECVEGVRRLMESNFSDPVNIGSDEMVTINQLVDIASSIEGKEITKKHIDGPLGVAGRNSDNKLIKESIDWAPDYPLAKGIEKTYKWIKEQVNLK